MKTIALSAIRQAVFSLREEGELEPLNGAADKLRRSGLVIRMAKDLAHRLRGKRPLKPESPVTWVVGDNRAFDITILHQGDEPILQFVDASARRTMEAGLVQNAKTQAIGRLAGGIAHDFNNILTAVIGHCDTALETILMMKEMGTDADAQPSRTEIENSIRSETPEPEEGGIAGIDRDLKSIRHNSERASRMVRQLLAFAREQDLLPEVIDIPETLTSAWKLIGQLAGEMVHLEKNIPNAVSPIRMDKGQLDQIFINLVINAKDAMPFGGTIVFSVDETTVSTARRNRGDILLPGTYTRIQVTDSGSGIDLSIMERIFDPFYTTKNVGYGTGLGLAVIDGIMRQSGGYITVENSPNRLEGARFSLLFPALSKHEYEESRSKVRDAVIDDVPVPHSPSSVRRVVMLVEDEDSVREILCRALSTRALIVMTAKEGDEALDLLEKEDEPIDLLITDLIMPGITGDRLISLVREKYGPTPAICISGYAEHELFDVVRNMKEVVIINKPFNIRELRDKALKMTAEHKRER